MMHGHTYIKFNLDMFFLGPEDYSREPKHVAQM